MVDAEHGASIAVNGVCLTVVEHDSDGFTADVMAQTLEASGLGALVAGSRVNLERAVRADARLGGHIVQGHVDGVGHVLSITPDEHWTVVRVGLPESLSRYVVAKGSITVDGVSLTVSQVSPVGEEQPWFSVSLIPTTQDLTTLGSLDKGQSVNRRGRRPGQVRRTPHLRKDHMSAPAEPVVVLDTIEKAISEIAAGRMVVVVDDEDRENEGDLVMAASKATPEAMAFIIKHTSGVVCVPMEGEDLDRLKLPPMTYVNEDRKGTAYSISVDARDGVSTGISAADRSRTARCSQTPPPSLTRSLVRATSSRCVRSPVACCVAPVTPRRPSTSPAWPVSRRPVSSPRSSTTTARCRGFRTWCRSPRSTGWR